MHLESTKPCIKDERDFGILHKSLQQLQEVKIGLVG